MSLAARATEADFLEKINDINYCTLQGHPRLNYKISVPSAVIPSNNLVYLGKEFPDKLRHY